MTTGEVSHGRGGAGNINADDTTYVDGEVVRVGVEGSHGDGAYSTGRGGSGNIGDAGTNAARRSDKVLIPDVAVRPSSDNHDYHTGRGGAGNERKKSRSSGEESHTPAVDAPAENGAKVHISLADKLKNKLFGIKK